MNPAEFVEALLSISMQQDFTGYSYRDTLSSTDVMAAKKERSLPHCTPLPICSCSSPYTSPAADWIRKLIWLKKKRDFPPPSPPFSHPCFKYFLQVKKLHLSRTKQNQRKKQIPNTKDAAQIVQLQP